MSLLEQLGGKALGLSGVDGAMLTCVIANPELGYVGEIVSVDPEPIQALLGSGYIPMIAPLGIHRFDGSENAGKPLNINGDTVAGELARELGAERLVFLTDVGGVMDGGDRVIPRLDRRRAGALLSSGVVGGGMIPKLQACLRALESSSAANIIDGRRPDALLDCLSGRSPGTTITAGLRRS